jgi:hypothetical protein
MTVITNKEQAAASVTAAVAERDTIQANLLDLDGSFGRRLLAGATLSGETQRRWASASTDLTALWDTFHAYSAVVDRAAEIAGPARRVPAARVPEVARLLTGPSVRLDGALAPIGQRELTSGMSSAITVAASVTAMRSAYARVSAVCAGAEAVWNEVADGLQQAGARLDQAEQQAAGIADTDLASALTLARANITHLRDMLNTDPLALGPAGTPASQGAAALAGLGQQVAVVVARAADLARLRADADRRLAAAEQAVRGAATAWQDAAAARQRAAVKIAGPAGTPLTDTSWLQPRLDALPALRAEGRWARLSADLESLIKDAAQAEQQCRDAERAAVAELDQRNEMRGLLDAYKAKATSLGAAEDAGLADLYQRARDALWTAPCDLAVATAAVTTYQRAVLALSAPGGRR